MRYIKVATAPTEAPAIIDDNETSLVKTWSSNKIKEEMNGMGEDVCTSGLTVSNASSVTYRFRRKGNIVYFEIRGTWTGPGASSATAEFLTGLPARFRPTNPATGYVSATPAFAYNTATSPYCFVGRPIVFPDGSFKIGEHAWPTNSSVIAIGYYLIDGER